MYRAINKTLIHIVVHASILVCFFLPAKAQDQPPDEAVKAASEFLESLKSSIKLGKYPDFFTADENIDDLQITYSYKYFLIDGSKIYDNDTKSILPYGNTLEAYLKFYIWGFVISKENEARLEILLKSNNNKWHVSCFRKPSPFIKDFNRIWSNNPNSYSVADYPGKYIFAFHKSDDVVTLYPLTNLTARDFGFSRNKNELYGVLNESDIMAIFKEIISRDIDGSKKE